MKKSLPKKIQNLAKAIISKHKPERIILFGSYAWGKPTKDSDVDLCVIERSPGNRRERQIRLRRLLMHSGIPVDILSFTPSEIEKRLSDGDLFVKDILTHGSSLYARKKGKTTPRVAKKSGRR